MRNILTSTLLSVLLITGCSTDGKKDVAPTPKQEDNCSKSDSMPMPMVVKKPAIYLYPKSEQKIDVKLKIDGKIIKTIPKYGKNGWSVIVDSSGIIDNKYDYLFYENTLNTITLPKEGWVKEYSELNGFFNKTLKELGLNQKESKQFIEYWLKTLKKDKIYEIKLLSRDFLDKHMQLNISPKPDTTIRVIFSFKEANKKYSLKEPILTKPKRVGFVALEWGGIVQ